MEDDVLLFKVVNNTLIIYHNNTDEWQGAGYTYIADQVNTFLKAYDIEPTYIDPNFVYGYLDEVTETWSGMMEHVKRIIDDDLKMHWTRDDYVKRKFELFLFLSFSLSLVGDVERTLEMYCNVF